MSPLGIKKSMGNNKNNFHGYTFKIAKLFRQISSLLQDIFSNSGYDFTNEQLWILVILWDKEGISQQTIGNTLLRDKATISHLINVLEDKAFVERRTDPKDERQKLIFLTKEGASLKQEVQPRISDAFAEVSADLEHHELNEFGTSLESLVKGFN